MLAADDDDDDGDDTSKGYTLVLLLKSKLN